jgi:hypothetical protein
MNKGVVHKGRLIGRTFFPPRHVIAQRCGISQKDVGYRFYMRRMNEVFTIFAKSIRKLFSTC